MSIDKVLLEDEINVKKSRFDFGHDLNTTFSWGEMQPVNCQVVPLPGFNRFRISSLVRCFPLISPVFGRVSYKQFHNFISFSDIFPKWKEMLGNQDSLVFHHNPDNLASNRWSMSIINHFPTISADALLYAVLTNRSYGQFYQRQTGNTPIQSDLDNPNVFFQWNSGASWSVFRETCWQNFPHSVKAISPFIATANNTSSNVYFPPADADFRSFGKFTSGGVDINFMGTFKLNSAGRRLMKILRGLGYMVSFRNHSINQSLLPLLAWYRAYWCNFGIPQYQSWESSSAYRLIEQFSHLSSSKGDVRRITLDNISETDTWELFLNFMDDLCDCFYVDNKQLESIAINDTTMNINRAASNPFANFEYFRSLNGSTYSGVTAGNIMADFDTDNKTLFNKIDDDLLKALYVYVNKSTQWGSDIGKALKNRGFTDFVDNCGTHFLGSESFEVEISEVTMQGNTDSRQLGSPAGRGVGFNKNKWIKFKNHEPGYFISMGCVVPICKTTQTVDLTLLGTRMDTFYSGLLDAKGYSGMPYVGVGYSEGVQHVDSVDSLVENGTFGLYPRFTEWKTKKNVLNGAFANPSELDSMSSYSLDRLLIRNPFEPRDYNVQNGSFKSNDVQGGQKTSANGVLQDYAIPEAGLIWKKPTKTQFFGHFDRIFNQLAEKELVYDSFNYKTYDFAYRDTFIVHSVIDFKNNSAMLPLDMSWQTMEENGHPKGATSVNVK